MKKTSKRMRPGYDFSGGVRGKYSASFRKGTSVDAAEVLAKRSRKPKRQALNRYSTVSAPYSRRPFGASDPIFTSIN